MAKHSNPKAAVFTLACETLAFADGLKPSLESRTQVRAFSPVGSLLGATDKIQIQHLRWSRRYLNFAVTSASFAATAILLALTAIAPKKRFGRTALICSSGFPSKRGITSRTILNA